MTRVLWGPFSQILSLRGLPNGGPVADDTLELIPDGGILIEDGVIVALGAYVDLKDSADSVHEIEGCAVATPGLIDCHTHICWAGSRAADYARRLAGMTYLEIAAAGGGIKDTVAKTRAASESELLDGVLQRCDVLRKSGVTTCEVKSGYGLSTEHELKMLRAIKAAQEQTAIDLIPTCLAAHMVPQEAASTEAYLANILEDLLPCLQAESLAERVDIFVEDGAFDVNNARRYLLAARAMGFRLTIHADQFSSGGAQLAVELRADSADHLEASDSAAIDALRGSDVVPVVLPGASLGLGLPYAPARQLLDAGLPLAIASDWNPGSAPMGRLLTQAALIGAAEKLSHAETWLAMTARAAHALRLNDRGQLDTGLRADLAIYPCADYREILYHQGAMDPVTTVT